MKIKLSFIIIWGILISHCCYNQSISNIEYYCDLNRPSKIPISELINQIEFIPLETKTDNYINYISDVRIVNGKIFIHDDNNGGIIYIYDNYGRYLNKIDKRGKGPDEYISLTRMDVAKEHSEITIFDGLSSRMITYNPNGKCLKNKKIDLKAFIPTSFRLNTEMEPTYIFSTYINFNNKPLFVLTDENLKTQTTLVEDVKPCTINIPGSDNNFCSSSNYIYYYNNSDAITYVLKDNKLHSKIHIKFSSRMYLPDQITKNDLDPFKVAYNNGDIVINYITKVTDAFIHSEFFYNTKRQILIINRTNNKEYLFNNSKLMACDCGALFYPCGTTQDGHFIFSIDPIDLKDFISLIDPSLRIINKENYQYLLKKVNTNDNPILFFINYK